jgi:hypothetical protein
VKLLFLSKINSPSRASACGAGSTTAEIGVQDIKVTAFTPYIDPFVMVR